MAKILVTPKKIGGNILSSITLFIGLVKYSFLKKNNEKEYQALIRCFCWSRGLSNDLISKFISLKESFKRNNISDEAQKMINSIRKDGFYVIKDGLSELPLNQLTDLTHTLRCDSPSKQESDKIIKYEDALRGDLPQVTQTRMDYREDELLQYDFVQSIVLNPIFLEVAKGYLGVQPKADIVTMWWTLANKKADLAGDAQMYHFDMDRVKWLKVFIYLTDVDNTSGPHTFIKGSHRSYAIPRSFLAHGYQRINDKDLFTHYRPSDEISFEGKKGTIIFEDTRGLHKGAPIKAGARLVFQIQYTNTLFGAPVNKKYPGFKNFFSSKLFSGFEG